MSRYLSALLLSLAATFGCGATQSPESSTEGPEATDSQAPSADAQPQVMDVVATGVGADPEQAKQNAFSAAIEQVVGVLVDAETIVKNDEVVRDEVLTFSRGYVNEFKEIGSATPPLQNLSKRSGDTDRWRGPRIAL